ncbi:MAG: Wzz/FepE/Etk N-terminal domain-containing protein [Chloroflexota bacterium]
MELTDYLRILRQRGWLIALMAVLTAGATFGYSKMQTPLYESTLKLLVSPSRTDFGQAQAAKTLLRSYVVWLHSGYRAQKVIDELKLDMLPDELLGQVAVASDDSNFIIQLTVENTDPNLANDVARTWGNQLIQWRIQDNATLRKEDRIDVEFIDDPKPSLARPQTTINTAAGIVLGALLGLIVVFLLEWIESGVVRRPQDVERYLDMPVIGAIPGGDS